VLQQKASVCLELLVVRIGLLINLARLVHHPGHLDACFEAMKNLLFEWKVLKEPVLLVTMQPHQMVFVELAQKVVFIKLAQKVCMKLDQKV
jgi:hypothetical protein